MDLDRMLERCVREQWEVSDVRLDEPPRATSRDDEMATVQYFTDMAGIERLAAELFADRAERCDDPTLARIFETFVADELRHAEVAERLAAHHDVHHHRRYEQSPHLGRFRAHFLAAMRILPEHVATYYVTVGELALDMALLRSIDDATNDPCTRRAMALVNRDEARHVAIDFYMCERYASEAYRARLAASGPRSAAEHLEIARVLVPLFWNARPFFRACFFEPMSRTDPTGKRLREAMKRVQLLCERPGVSALPFVSSMRALFHAYQRPVVRAIAGSAIVRVIGLEPELLRRLNSDAELRRGLKMSWDELADDALATARAS